MGAGESTIMPQHHRPELKPINGNNIKELCSRLSGVTTNKLTSSVKQLRSGHTLRDSGDNEVGESRRLFEGIHNLLSDDELARNFPSGKNGDKVVESLLQIIKEKKTGRSAVSMTRSVKQLLGHVNGDRDASSKCSSLSKSAKPTTLVHTNSTANHKATLATRRHSGEVDDSSNTSSAQCTSSRSGISQNRVNTSSGNRNGNNSSKQQAKRRRRSSLDMLKEPSIYHEPNPFVIGSTTSVVYSVGPSRPSAPPYYPFDVKIPSVPSRHKRNQSALLLRSQQLKRQYARERAKKAQKQQEQQKVKSKRHQDTGGTTGKVSDDNEIHISTRLFSPAQSIDGESSVAAHLPLDAMESAEGTELRDAEMLMSDRPYYIPNFLNLLADKEEADRQASIEIPQWRLVSLGPPLKHPPLDSDGEFAEDISDDDFETRHMKWECEERRRDKRDRQRQREVEMRQRWEEKQRRKLIEMCLITPDGETRLPCLPASLIYNMGKVKNIRITNRVPVVAFGVPVRSMKPSDFQLPWIRNTKTSSKRTRMR